MKLSPLQIQRLEQFLDRVKTETYPEPRSELHTQLTHQMMEACLQQISLPTNAKVLDVGCGQGLALELFTQRGYHPIGITLNPVDVEACQAQGFEVYEMDQSFLEFDDTTFDFIWCRHCLEHSIFPYFTLGELYRVLKPGAYLYVEVPAPETSQCHEANRNHYSILGTNMWLELIARAGFDPKIVTWTVDFTLPSGKDTYWSYLAFKPEHTSA